VKLHKDGTLDGTPAEIAEYQRLMEPKMKPMVQSVPPVLVIGGPPPTRAYNASIVQHLFNKLYNDAEK